MKYHEWVVKAKQQSIKDKISIPIIPASTYRDRERKLSASGLLDWERFWLVAHRLDTPGMKEMLAYRRERYLKAKEEKMTVQDYRNEISRKYKRKGWYFKDGKRLDPFKMLDQHLGDDKKPKDKWPYSSKVPKVKKNFAKTKKLTEKDKAERPMGGIFRPPVYPF